MNIGPITKCPLRLRKADSRITGADLGNNRKPLTREEVIEAACGCFEKFSVSKTSIKDVAAALGVTRQTVHRLFESRSALIEAVADVRIGVLAKRLQSEFKRFMDIEEALVEGSLLSLELGGSDPVMVEIQDQADHAVDQFMFRGSANVQLAMIELWGPVFVQARSQGRLRPGISTDQAVEWIRNVHAMLIMRDDYDQARKAFMLRTFLVPAIVRD